MFSGYIQSDVGYLSSYRLISLLGIFFNLVISSALAAELPQITDTEFFTKTAWDCQDVEMEKWSHPTKQIFIERGVKLEKLSLCNDKKLPVFYAELPYDPHLAHNDDYLRPLYYNLLKANGWWSFAIVATSDNTIIVVSGNKETFSEKLEDYVP